MPDKKLIEEKASIDYKSEYERINKLCAELQFENTHFVNEVEDLKRGLSEREFQIRELQFQMANLTGQVEAFKFCMAKGNVEDDR